MQSEIEDLQYKMSDVAQASEVGTDLNETEKSCQFVNEKHVGFDSEIVAQTGEKKKRPPRSERKRLLRQQKLSEKKLRRIEKKYDRRQVLKDGGDAPEINAEDASQRIENVGQTDTDRLHGDQGHEHIPKKQKIEQKRERQRQAMVDGQRIAIDCSLEKHMSPKECSKLAQQLCRLYGNNSKCELPAHLYFTGLVKTGHLYTECVRKNAGFENYMVDMSEKHHSEVFPKESIVCLSPDSPNVLHSVDKDKVYVIGGLVDEHVQKGKSVSSAEALNLATVRLPLDEHMEKTESGTFKKVLTVNQVFGILLTYMERKDWKAALREWVPARHGFRLKEDITLH